MAKTDKPADDPTAPPTWEDALRLALETCRDPRRGGTADAAASALLAVIGSSPSQIALQTLAAAGQASGQMFINSVANQQQTNILSMVATANCVQAMLGQTPNVPYPHPVPFNPVVDPYAEG